jgi:TfoX/Sxy family transcriptional regulator of competence genes
MPYDEALAERVRESLLPADEVSERKMFGGLAFLMGGHMFCGIVHDELMVKLGTDGATEALRRPGVRPMDFTGRISKSMVFVAPDALAGPALGDWISQAAAYARSLPPKPAGPRGG